MGAADPRRLTVRVLGGFTIEGIDSGRLGSRKARTLLKRLVLARGQPVSADSLVDTLWPDRRPAEPADQISVLVSRLRGVLGADRLRRTDVGYSVSVDWLDLDALAERVEELDRRLASGSLAAARATAAAALELARGPLLPDEEGAEWLTAERVAAERLTQQARLRAGESALLVGDGWQAGNAARDVLASEPYHESAIRLLMRALVASGQPALAVSSYTDFATRMRDELGIDPGTETEGIYLAILRGEQQSPPDRAQLVELVGRDVETARSTTSWTVRGVRRGWSASRGRAASAKQG